MKTPILFVIFFASFVFLAHSEEKKIGVPIDKSKMPAFKRDTDNIFIPSDLSLDTHKRAVNVCTMLFEDLWDNNINAKEIIIYKKNYLYAFQYIQICRSKEVVDILINFIGKYFTIMENTVGSPKFEILKLADETLIAIGLPAVDGIFQRVAQNKLEESKYETAFKIVLSILGNKEALQARAKVLGLSENAGIRKFLSTTLTEKPMTTETRGKKDANSDSGTNAKTIDDKSSTKINNTKQADSEDNKNRSDEKGANILYVIAGIVFGFLLGVTVVFISQRKRSAV